MASAGATNQEREATWARRLLANPVLASRDPLKVVVGHGEMIWRVAAQVATRDGSERAFGVRGTDCSRFWNDVFQTKDVCATTCESPCRLVQEFSRRLHRLTVGAIGGLTRPRSNRSTNSSCSPVLEPAAQRPPVDRQPGSILEPQPEEPGVDARHYRSAFIVVLFGVLATSELAPDDFAGELALR